MIKQIKYFQSVVRNQNFTKAADENFISQSAISQQIQALEKELGFKLLKREGRKFSLTAAGDFFYKKSLILMNDFERICAESSRIANGIEQEFSIGYLRHYRGKELKKAIEEFNEKNPEIFLKTVAGTHEELYEFLRSGKIDLAIRDLRRKPSEQYINFFLTRGYFYAELPKKNSLTNLEFLTTEDLKNTPIILISPPYQENIEEIFFKEYFGVKSEFIFAKTLEEAHLQVITNKGFFLTEFSEPPEISNDVKYIPLVEGGKQLFRKYFAFWRKDNAKKYLEDFAEILRKNFPDESESKI